MKNNSITSFFFGNTKHDVLDQSDLSLHTNAIINNAINPQEHNEKWVHLRRNKLLSFVSPYNIPSGKRIASRGGRPDVRHLLLTRARTMTPYSRVYVSVGY